MAEAYVEIVLTKAGEDIMARVIAGLKINFKRIAIGDGFDYDTENFKYKTSLVNEVASIPELMMHVTSDNLVKISGKLTKSDLQRSFYNREMGLYIVDPDNEDNEILYAYANKNDIADYLTPDIANYGVEKEFEINVMVGRSANVNIYISSTRLTTEVTFNQSEWELNSDTGFYELTLGAVNEVLKIYRTTLDSRKSVPLVSVDVEEHISKLISLNPFTGSAITL